MYATAAMIRPQLVGQLPERAAAAAAHTVEM